MCTTADVPAAATSCVGATLTILLATASIIDADHRLRPERLAKQTRGRKLEHRLQEAIFAVGSINEVNEFLLMEECLGFTICIVLKVTRCSTEQGRHWGNSCMDR